MRIIKIKDKDTIIKVKRGKIEEEDGDVILNWVYSDLRSGPNSFYNIHNKGGLQLFQAVITYEANLQRIPDCSCFTTIPGQLNCKMVLHSVIPTLKSLYSKSFFNIAQTLKTYMRGNICKTMSIYIPEQAELCMFNIKELLLNLGLEEVILLYKTENEFNVINNYFSAYEYKQTRKEKINDWINKTMIKIGSRRMLPFWVEKKLWSLKKENYGKRVTEKSGADSSITS